MTDSFIASFIFEFLGASAKWLVMSVFSLFKNKKRKPFSDFYKAKKTDSNSDIFLSGVSNILLGILVAIVLLFIFLIYLNESRY